MPLKHITLQQLLQQQQDQGLLIYHGHEQQETQLCCEVSYPKLHQEK